MANTLVVTYGGNAAAGISIGANKVFSINLNGINQVKHLIRFYKEPDILFQKDVTKENL